MKQVKAVLLTLIGMLVLSTSDVIAYEYLFPRFKQYTQQAYNSSKGEWLKLGYVTIGYFNSEYHNRIDSVTTHYNNGSDSRLHYKIYTLDAKGNYYTSSYIQGLETRSRDTFIYNSQDQLVQIDTRSGPGQMRRTFEYNAGQLTKMMTHDYRGIGLEWGLLAEDSFVYDVSGRLTGIAQKQMVGSEFKVVRGEIWLYGDKGNLLEIVTSELVDDQFVPITRLTFEGTEPAQNSVSILGSFATVRLDGKLLYIDGLESEARITIRDYLGRSLLSTVAMGGRCEIDRSDLPPGAYLITDRRRVLSKLILP